MVSIWKRKFIWDIVMAVLVVFLPFLLYTHLLFDNFADTITILGYEYYHGFNGTRVLIWFFITKLIAILLLILWFLNNYYWWRYFIFIPLALWIHTLVELIFELPNSNENITVLYSFLTILLIFLLLILIQRYLDKYEISMRISATLRNWSTTEYKKLYKQINNKTSSILNLNNRGDKEGKLRSFYFINLTIKGKLERYLITKKRGIQIRRFDIFIVIIMGLIPIIYYTPWLVPVGLKQYKLLWFTINSSGFNDVSTFLWFLGTKICILIPLIIWFITSQNWWRYAILSPIILTIYQLWEAVQPSIQTDNISFIQALPLIIIIVVFLLLISKTVKYQSKILDIYNVVSEEIEQLLQKVDDTPGVPKNKQILDYLKHKNNKEKNEKLKITSLIKIREELLMQLKTNT